MKLLTTCLIACAALSSNAYAETSYNDLVKDAKEVISTNVDYVKGNLIKRLQKEEKRLQEYKEKLDEAQDDETVVSIKKKIKKVEKAIEHLNAAMAELGIVEK